jgi:hypothetical protein
MLKAQSILKAQSSSSNRVRTTIPHCLSLPHQHCALGTEHCALSIKV